MTRARVLRRSAVLCSLAGVVACGDPVVMRTDSGNPFAVDAGPVVRPIAPVISALPASTPFAVATVTGRAPDARRVIVEGAPNPIAATVLPDGSFCVDVPLGAPGPYSFNARSITANGIESETRSAFGLTFDPAAPPPPGAALCDGSDPRPCVPRAEECGNSTDEDCDRIPDARDPDCATCRNDVLEPNDTATAPLVSPQRYDNLELCPGDVDYYGVFAPQGRTIAVQLLFSHAMGDLGLSLLRADGTTEVARSFSADDDESLTHLVAETGRYVVEVGASGSVSNTYALILEVRP